MQDFDHAELEALAEGRVVQVGRHGAHDRGQSVVCAVTDAHLLQALVDLRFLEREDALCCLESVHDWHVEVHEDNLELHVAARLLAVLDEQVDSFLAAESLAGGDAQRLKQGAQRDQVEGVVIHDQRRRPAVATLGIALDEIIL